MLNAFRWFIDHTLINWTFFDYTVLVAIEWLFGRKQRASWRNVLHNYGYVLTALFILIFVRQWGGEVAAAISKVFGGPYIDLTFSGEHGTVASNFAAVLITAFVFDGFYYWHHRAQHLSPWLWLTHKLHHSDPNLGITTAYKHHWTDDTVRIVTIMIPIAVLFKFQPPTLFWVTYLISLQGLLIHLNVDLDFGIFNWLTVSPNMHRLHHSSLEEHRDKNFAAIFTIYDRLFGTYMAPSREAPPTGTHDNAVYSTLIHAHFYPFLEGARLLPRRVKRDSITP